MLRNAFATWRKKVEKKKLMKNGQFSNSSTNHLRSETTPNTINSFPKSLNKEFQEKQSSKKSINKIKQSVKFDSSNSFGNQNNSSEPLLASININKNINNELQNVV